MTDTDPRDYPQPTKVDDWSTPSGHRSDGLLGSAPTSSSGLRDAAVDPDPSDFPGVPNAGTDNPHGPTVVCIEVGSDGYDQAVEALE